MEKKAKFKTALIVVSLIGIMLFVFIINPNLFASFGIGSILIIVAYFLISFSFLRYFRNENPGRKFLVEASISIIMLFVLAGQLSVSNEQRIISDQQTRILEQTSQSIKPDLRIVSSQGNPNYDFDVISKGNQPIGVGIINLGKSLAPSALIWIESEEFSGQIDANSGALEIENLESLGYNSSFFEFRTRYSSYLDFDFGLKNITFFVKCPFCENPESYQNIPICVYSGYNNITKECGEGWR